MLDFRSSLYLGMQHPSELLRPWRSLTTGLPAVVHAPSLSGQLAAALATRQGVERALLARSTLHGFWDVFGVLADSEMFVAVDAGTYPVARWGAERAEAHLLPVLDFAHHDAADLARLLARPDLRGRRPLVVADGLCTGCGKTLPAAAYLDALRPRGGLLVIDDTQAVGLLGRNRSAAAPYGSGGGGTLAALGLVRPPDVVVVSSLAKGLGVPLAVIGGPAPIVAALEMGGETRIHGSPPSNADLRAAEHALALDGNGGDRRRRRLADLVRHFRRRLREAGIAVGHGLFPVQALPRLLRPVEVNSRLLREGVRAVVLSSRCRPQPRLTFLITLLHGPADLDVAVGALRRAATSDRGFADGRRTG
jgi:8-amino-7-oxononanoate synthase